MEREKEPQFVDPIGIEKKLEEMTERRNKSHSACFIKIIKIKTTQMNSNIA